MQLCKSVLIVWVGRFLDFMFNLQFSILIWRSSYLSCRHTYWLGKRNQINSNIVENCLRRMTLSGLWIKNPWDIKQHEYICLRIHFNWVIYGELQRSLQQTWIIWQAFNRTSFLCTNWIVCEWLNHVYIQSKEQKNASSLICYQKTDQEKMSEWIIIFRAWKRGTIWNFSQK